MEPLKEEEDKHLIEEKVQKRTQDLGRKGWEILLEPAVFAQLNGQWREKKSQFKNLDAFLYEAFEKALTEIVLKTALKPNLKIRGEIVHNSLKFAIIR
jgi:ATP-dependent Clp protease ATP-binding subunit ClpA